MEFYSVRDLRTSPKMVWDTLGKKNEVIITNNGKPNALMIHITKDNYEETIQAIRQAQAMIAVNSMRDRAASAGFMSEGEINAEIIAAREGMRE